MDQFVLGAVTIIGIFALDLCLDSIVSRTQA